MNLAPSSFASVNYISSDSSLTLLQRYTVPDQLKLTGQPLTKMEYLSDGHIACTYNTSICQTLQRREHCKHSISNYEVRNCVLSKSGNKGGAIEAPSPLSPFGGYLFVVIFWYRCPFHQCICLSVYLSTSLSHFLPVSLSFCQSGWSHLFIYWFHIKLMISCPYAL